MLVWEKGLLPFTRIIAVKELRTVYNSSIQLLNILNIFKKNICLTISISRQIFHNGSFVETGFVIHNSAVQSTTKEGTQN